MRWQIHGETEAWGNPWLSAWELPMGLIEAGESPAEAAAREVEEETGWRVGGLQELMYSEPAAGIMDSAHHVFRATTAVRIGEPTERNESDRIEWIPLAEVPAMIARREIVSGITLVGLQQALLQG